MTEYKHHYPVMSAEILSYLQKAAQNSSSNLFADLTFGAGGHAIKILENISDSFLIAFDQDPEAYHHGIDILKKKCLSHRCTFYHKNFEHFNRETKHLPNEFFGIVADLGVSSHHLDTGERGFSFKKKAYLDMRMNNTDPLSKTAAQLLNEWNENQIATVLAQYGEEKFSKKIAKLIIDYRKSGKAITTTTDLENLISHVYSKKTKTTKIHPATQTFQALRIAVNRELEILEKVIPDLISRLAINGVLCIISFQSLEDKIVKKAFKRAGQSSTSLEILTRRPQIPSEKEVFENFRSRSAKLRVIKRVDKKRHHSSL